MEHGPAAFRFYPFHQHRCVPLEELFGKPTSELIDLLPSARFVNVFFKMNPKMLGNMAGVPKLIEAVRPTRSERKRKAINVFHKGSRRICQRGVCRKTTSVVTPPRSPGVVHRDAEGAG